MSWFDQSPQSNPYSTLVSVSGPIASSPVSGPIFDTQPAMYVPVPSVTNYMLPDERAISRTNFQHMMLRTAIGGNYLAPVEDPRCILDVGCGSGRWAYELAERFVQARIVGVDLTPPSNYADISGVYGLTPPSNLSFQKADVFEGLPFAASTFNFIHQRLLALAIPLRRWQPALAELVRLTHPGGWVELVEADSARNGGPALETFQRWVATLAHQRGIEPHIARSLGSLLQGAGLRGVVTRSVELPIGRHGGHFGELMAEDFLARVEQLGAMILSSQLATPQEYDNFLSALTAEMDQYTCVQPFCIAYGRR